MDCYIYSGTHYSETWCSLWRQVLEQPLSGRNTGSFINPPTERWKATSSSISEGIPNITEVTTGRVDFTQGRMLRFKPHIAKNYEKVEDMSKTSKQAQ